MAFVKIPGLAGKLFVPDEKPQTEKKHDCKDCFSCQHCPDDRCRLCRQERRRKESDPDRKMPHRCARHERVPGTRAKSWTDIFPLDLKTDFHYKSLNAHLPQRVAKLTDLVSLYP